jgi:hypothetical protein
MQSHEVAFEMKSPKNAGATHSWSPSQVQEVYFEEIPPSIPTSSNRPFRSDYLRETPPDLPLVRF